MEDLVMKDEKRVVGYISCAVKSEEECQEQREAIELSAARDGVEISHFYIDNGVAGNRKKPMLNMLIEDAQKGMISKIYLKDIDRLSRSITLLIHYLKLLLATNVEIYFYNDSAFNFNKDSDSLLPMLTSMASANHSAWVRNGKNKMK
jgi:DNA invertase Pin-like site-specific DNA recombinase